MQTDVNAVALRTEKRNIIAKIVKGISASGNPAYKEYAFAVNPNIEVEDEALEVAYQSMVAFMDLSNDGGAHVFDDIRSKLEESVGGDNNANA